jgi:hypothetical protein
MAGKAKAYWFHFNKPESKKQGRNVLTVHYAGQCRLVHDIKLRNIDLLETRHRAKQPRCVLAGKGIVTFAVDNGLTVATITT